MNFRQFSTLLSRKPSVSAEPAPTPPLPPKEEKGYDHLVFLIHGIGEHEEKWKVIVPKLLRCHKRVENYMGAPARVKWIPIEWHSVLHTQTDEHVVKVTPKGMAGPRSFINNTLIDILFWASPYGQTIITEVGQQLNQLYSQFKKDHPDFTGSVSIYAHSLGSIICYDLLSNQPAPTGPDASKQDSSTAANTSLSPASAPSLSPLNSPRLSFKPEGNIATWQRLSAKPTTPATADRLPGEFQLKYPLIEFDIDNFFMVGSPTGIFLTARGADYLVRLPKCANIYNIYNPNDPVSYLIEPLVDPGFVNLAPSLVPHIPDPTEALKGAVARGGKSLFSYYKNTTTTTTTTTAPGGSSTTTTTTVTKEVVPTVPTSPTSSSAPASVVSSPTILPGTVYGPTGAQFMPVVVCNQTFGHKRRSSQLNGFTPDHSVGIPMSPKPEIAEIIAFEELSVSEAAAGGGGTDDALGLGLGLGLGMGIGLLGEPTLSPRTERVLEKTSNISLLPTEERAPQAASGGNNNNNVPTTPRDGSGGGSDKTFFDGVRYDFKLQPSGMIENLSEYAALINAHRCYWDSKDVMLFVLQHLL